ncbi:MAG TPA: indole-3-glycerol phosphate synthase TrpC [Candidatus Koribacter sp.]|jgi:indole-3-glycerol phosphate synthase
MPDRLHDFIAEARRNVTAARTASRARDLEKQARDHRPRGFKRALVERSQSGTAVIAELKKASPSKGLLRAEFDPASLAAELEAAGATCLSVLTNEPHFQGSLRNLTLASQAVKIPCLRKDFIVDAIQVVEARAHGADAILLIVAVLQDKELRDLHDEAKALGLDVLCEVQQRDEMKRAADLGFDLIGVNNRDLHTFHVDMENSLRFIEDFPLNAFRVAESGIDSPQTIQRLKAAGYQAFLVGERLMRSDSPGDTLRELLA